MYCGIVTTKRWEWLTQITPRPKEYYYGVTPGRGEVVLWARNELRDYVEDGILTSDMLSVRIKNNDETVVVRSVSDSEYDMSSKLLTLELSDCLSSWGKRKYPGRGLTEEMSAFDLMAEVLSGLKYTVDDVEKMCTKTIPVGTEGEEMTVARYLKGIRIPYPYLEPDTYRATIEKFCRLAQICCYADDNNFPVFVSGRPVMLKAERERPIYDIPKSHQFGPVRKSVIKKNKVKRVEVEVNDVIEEFGDIGGTQTINYTLYEFATWGSPAKQASFIYYDEKENDYFDKTELVQGVYQNQDYLKTIDVVFNLSDNLIKESDLQNIVFRADINTASMEDNNNTSNNSLINKVLVINKLPLDKPHDLFINNVRFIKNKVYIDVYARNMQNYNYNVLNAKITCRGIIRKQKKEVISYG